MARGVSVYLAPGILRSRQSGEFRGTVTTGRQGEAVRLAHRGTPWQNWIGEGYGYV